MLHTLHTAAQEETRDAARGEAREVVANFLLVSSLALEALLLEVLLT